MSFDPHQPVVQRFTGRLAGVDGGGKAFIDGSRIAQLASSSLVAGCQNASSTMR